MNKIFVLLMVLLVLAISYGGWYFKRWFNYELGYSSNVLKEIEKAQEPLLDRIIKLEEKVKRLEK